MTDSTKPIADFFDRECCAAVDAGASLVPGSEGVTALLVEALDKAGISGMNVLELGSGAGALSRELASRGAAKVEGIDLSPMSVEAATAAAAEADLADRVRYRVGDGALEQLGRYDALVAQKVVCCYPRPDRLLANTLPAAARLYALVLPESRGIVGLVTRAVVAVENFVNRLTREPFRAYIHDVRKVEATIAAAGFERRLSTRHWAWLVLVFVRR